MNKIKFFFQRIYRLSLSFEKQEKKVWEDLKQLHSDAGWQSGVYEGDKYIESVFEISDGIPGTFGYFVFQGEYYCRFKALPEFPEELTTEAFILASHFNNLLNNGVVTVNPAKNYVEYEIKTHILVPLLYSGELHSTLTTHYNTSKEIYTAFQRLVNEREAPAIIIADLLNEKEGQQNQSS